MSALRDNGFAFVHQTMASVVVARWQSHSGNCGGTDSGSVTDA